MHVLSAHPNTVEWLLSERYVLPGIVLWFTGWLLLEGLWYWRTKHPFDVNETRISLSVGAVVGGAQVAISLLLIPLLWLIWPYRLQTLSMDSVWHWLMAWVIVDFAYYWIHRMLHVTRIGWSFHAPHHSIKQLTILDSLRMSWGEQPVGVFAYGIPLVLLGVPPHIAGLFYLFVSLYQLAVHTEIDWSLGPLNHILYTPAAHRSHHANTRPESDKNLGGFFILFDRLFGTYTPTRPDYRPPEYGLPGAEARSFKEAAFGEIRRFFNEVKGVRGLASRLKFAMTRPQPPAQDSSSPSH